MELTMNGVTALRPAAPGLVWYHDPKMVALVHRTAAKDCNEDEFNQFIAVARDLNLNPLRKQIYAFVFNKENAAKRNMVIVVAIDGMRAISARGGLYRPDNKAPRWIAQDALKDPLTNPLGIESCEVSIFTGHKLRDAGGAERIEWNEVVGVAYWNEFAPIKKPWGDDAGPARLDPKKDGWIKSGRHMIAKCAEAIAHRKANPEPLSMVYAEEETHRGQVIEGEYTDLTPSEMVNQADTQSRIERIGGPSLYAVFDNTGTMESVPMGQFFDRVDAHTKALAPAAVALFVDRNKVGLQAFWAHNKNDALELKKILDLRSGAVAGGPTEPSRDESARASPAPSQHGENNMGGAGSPASKTGQPKLPPLTGLLAERHRDNLARQIGSLETNGDLLGWARDGVAQINRLPEAMAEAVRAEFNSRQNRIKESSK
jgi:phage recombination protein Bet